MFVLGSRKFGRSGTDPAEGPAPDPFPAIQANMEPRAITAPATTADQRKRFAATYAVLEGAIKAHAFPGCAFGVLFAGDVVALDGLGHFTYEAGSSAVTINTVYDLASLTKVLATTALAMLLHDRNKLQLDQPLSEILPAFAARESAGSPRSRVTVRMLLDHSSGLPGYARLFLQASTPEALYDAALRQPLEAEPGTRVAYSDIGFLLLGRALERIAGEEMDSLCHRDIFQPLCMDTTRFCPPDGWKPAIPPTEDDTAFRHGIVQGVVNDENAFVMGGVAGQAGLFSNALDPLRFAQCILAQGKTPAGKQLFAPETVRLFSQRSEQPAGNSRALGWDTPTEPSSSGRYFSPASIGHLGFTGTSLWIDPESSMAAVLLTNRTWPSRENQQIREVRPQFYDAVAGTLLPGVKVLTGIRAWVTS